MDRADIERAVKLLAKAASTDSDAEAIALSEHSYRLLARVITSYDVDNRHDARFGAPGRERRLLKDRRAPRLAQVGCAPRAAYAGALYSEAATITSEPRRAQVNLHL